MATSKTSTTAEPTTAVSLYEQQQAQLPPPATPTQAELDAMMTGAYEIPGAMSDEQITAMRERLRSR